MQSITNITPNTVINHNTMLNHVESSTSLTSLEKNLLDLNKNDDTDKLFDYKLNAVATKAKLVKGAKRVPFEVNDKKTCSVLNFSDGAYNRLILSLIGEWENCQKTGKPFRFENMDIKILTFEKRFDKVGNHVDTKVVFSDEKHKIGASTKITAHFYNSTQRLKIEGKGFTEVVENVLKPYFFGKVDLLKSEILEYDKGVLQSLTGPVSNLTCNKCDFSFKTKLQLKKHKQQNHTKNTNPLKVNNPKTKKSLAAFKKPTIENTVTNIMLEDMSIDNTVEEEEVEIL